jgi:hypothetical protein
LSTASRVFTHRQPMALNEIKINFLLFLRGEEEARAPMEINFISMSIAL